MDDWMAGLVSERQSIHAQIYLSIHPLHLAGGQMEEGPLLPKLRGYFAEFLREVSLARLSLFDSPTCVGLRYGQLGERLEAFLGTLSGDTLWGDPSAQHSIA